LLSNPLRWASTQQHARTQRFDDQISMLCSVVQLTYCDAKQIGVG
jgi:hypothetical protein